MDKLLREKISNHILANSSQDSSGFTTAYEVVDACFDSITLLRRNKLDWDVIATQVIKSIETVTGQKISIAPSTLQRYYYAIKARSKGIKKKNSKSKCKSSPPGNKRVNKNADHVNKRHSTPSFPTRWDDYSFDDF